MDINTELEISFERRRQEVWMNAAAAATRRDRDDYRRAIDSAREAADWADMVLQRFDRKFKPMKVDT